MLEIKILAKKAGIIGIKAVTLGGAGKQIVLHVGPSVTAEPIINLLKYNHRWLISGDKIKIDLKELGFNWPTVLEENIRHLILEKPKTLPVSGV